MLYIAYILKVMQITSKVALVMVHPWITSALGIYEIISLIVTVGVFCFLLLKVAGAVRNRSPEMVEALFKMNRVNMVTDF